MANLKETLKQAIKVKVIARKIKKAAASRDAHTAVEELMRPHMEAAITIALAYYKTGAAVVSSMSDKDIEEIIGYGLKVKELGEEIIASQPVINLGTSIRAQTENFTNASERALVKSAKKAEKSSNKLEAIIKEIIK